MAIPTVTALYGSLNAFWNVLLAMNVTRLRRTSGVSMGAGESKELLVAIRMHANNAEFMPLLMLLLLLVELCGGSSLWLHVAGGLILVGRIAHAFGMPRPAPNAPRAIGTALTWGPALALGIWLLVLRSH